MKTDEEPLPALTGDEEAEAENIILLVEENPDMRSLSALVNIRFAILESTVFDL